MLEPENRTSKIKNAGVIDYLRRNSCIGLVKTKNPAPFRQKNAGFSKAQKFLTMVSVSVGLRIYASGQSHLLSD